MKTLLDLFYLTGPPLLRFFHYSLPHYSFGPPYFLHHLLIVLFQYTSLPNDISTPLASHPNLMHPPRTHIQPNPRPKRFLHGLLVFRICDCQLPPQYEVRRQRGVSMGRVVCVASVRPGEDVWETPGGDEGFCCGGRGGKGECCWGDFGSFWHGEWLFGCLFAGCVGLGCFDEGRDF